MLDILTTVWNINLICLHDKYLNGIYSNALKINNIKLGHFGSCEVYVVILCCLMFENIVKFIKLFVLNNSKLLYKSE